MSAQTIIEQMEATLQSLKENDQKFTQKGNQSAGTRARKHATELGKLTKQYRQSVQEKKAAV